jgi:hypothetical protein
MRPALLSGDQASEALSVIGRTIGANSMTEIAECDSNPEAIAKERA